jgi:hypothetical protein
MIKNIADFEIGTIAAFTETMVAMKENLVIKMIVRKEQLYDLDQFFVSPCKAGTSQAD